MNETKTLSKAAVIQALHKVGLGGKLVNEALVELGFTLTPFPASRKYCDDPDHCTYSDCPTAFCDRDKVPPPPTRQYYSFVDNCPAKTAYAPNCICWHDEGTGPRANDVGLKLEWRAKPTAGVP